MKEVIIELQAAKHYTVYYENDWLLYTLGSFLAYDVGSQSDWWIKWLADADQHFTFANAAAVEKYGQDVALIDLIDSVRCEPNLVSLDRVLKIDGDEFVKLIQTWSILQQRQVPAIKIVQEYDGKIEVFEALQQKIPNSQQSASAE